MNHMYDWINGAYTNLSKDVVLTLNNNKTIKGSERVKTFFDSVKNAFSDMHIRSQTKFGDDQNSQVVTWTISGKHSGVLNGYLPTGKNVSISGSSLISITNNQADTIELFFDNKHIEDQICPPPLYSINNEKVFNKLDGKGKEIYSLLLSTRNSQLLDSKHSLIHSLRRDALKAPDLDRLNHKEIKQLKQQSECIKADIKLNNNQDIELFIYSPSSSSNLEILPTILYLHGGGWSMGSPESYDLVNRKLAISCNAVVICVRYRLSPEHLYPAGFNDCCNVYQYLIENNEIGSLKINNEKIIIAGDSAGGAFAAALILKMRDEGVQVPAGALLLSPVTDMRLEDYHSYNHFAKNNIMIDHGLIGLIRGAYIEGDLWDDPYVSPMRGELKYFPKTFIMIGEEDPLYDENLCFSKKISRESGHEPVVLIGKDMPHHYHTFVGLSDEVDKVYEEISKFIQSI